jgi:DNA replication licensing factor MCM2
LKLKRDYDELREPDNTYDEEDLDHETYEPMHPAQRREVERTLEARDRQQRKAQRAAGSTRAPAFLYHSSDDELPEEGEVVEDDLIDDEEDELNDDHPADKTGATSLLLNNGVLDPYPNLSELETEDDMDFDPTTEIIDLKSRKGPLREWIVMEAPRKEIARRFRNFLASYVDSKGNCIYAERIRNMCAANRESLEVSYYHLSSYVPLLAMWLAECPSEMLKIFDEVALRMVLSQFPDYKRIHSEIHVRIIHLPLTENLRDIRYSFISFIFLSFNLDLNHINT